MPFSSFEDHFGENTCLKSLGVSGWQGQGLKQSPVPCSIRTLIFCQ